MYKHGNFLVVRYGGKLRESVLLHFNGKIRSAVESAFSYGGDFFRRDQNVYVFDFVLQLLGYIARMYSCGIKYAVVCGRHGTYAACVNDGKLGTTVGRVSVDIYI